jgi:hypothetical protein
MVDMNTYWHMHPEEAPASQRDDLGTEAMETDDAPDETFLLLQQATIPGFGFHDNDKKWSKFLIPTISGHANIKQSLSTSKIFPRSIGARKHSIDSSFKRIRKNSSKL